VTVAAKPSLVVNERKLVNMKLALSSLLPQPDKVTLLLGAISKASDDPY